MRLCLSVCVYGRYRNRTGTTNHFEIALSVPGQPSARFLGTHTLRHWRRCSPILTIKEMRGKSPRRTLGYDLESTAHIGL